MCARTRTGTTLIYAGFHTLMNTRERLSHDTSKRGIGEGESLLRSTPWRHRETRGEKEGREKSRPSLVAYAKGDGQPAGSPVETRDAFTVHPPS